MIFQPKYKATLRNIKLCVANYFAAFEILAQTPNRSQSSTTNFGLTNSQRKKSSDKKRLPLGSN